MAVDYGASNIQVVHYVESVRKRPGMYIGSTHQRGVLEALKMLMMFSGKLEAKEVQLKCLGQLRFVITAKHINEVLTQDILEHLSAGKEKIDDDFNYYDNWLGIYTIHALSKSFKAQLVSAEQSIILSAKRGVNQPLKIKVGNSGNIGFTLDFTLDPDIFQEIQEVSYPDLYKNLKQWMFLHPQSALTLKHKNHPPQFWHFPNGIQDLYQQRVDEFGDGMMMETELKAKILDFEIHICFGYSIWTQHLFMMHVFCNDDKLREDIVLGQGVLQGIEKVVKATYPEEADILDKRSLKDGLICTIHLKGKQPVFGGPTRERLDMPELVAPIAAAVENEINKNLKENPNGLKFWRLDQFPFRLCEAANLR